MNQLTESAVTIAMAIIGVAILAVIVSRNANTAGVLQAMASAFGNTLSVATAPVTGATVKPNLSYPGGMLSTSFGLQGGFPN